MADSSLEFGFLPFDSVVDTAFWHALSKKKLENYRLEEGPFPINGEFSNGTHPNINPRIDFSSSSLNGFSDTKCGKGNYFHANGYLMTLNTIDKFREMDKQAFLNDFGRKYICSEAVNESRDFLIHPDRLLTFSLLTYCDLKHHKFYYWFAFPAVYRDKRRPKLVSKCLIGEEFSPPQITALVEQYDVWRQHSPDAFFCLHSGDGLCVDKLETLDIEDENDYVGFCDPSSHEMYPGWPLRNLLYALSTLVKVPRTVKIICFRNRYVKAERVVTESLVLRVGIEPEEVSEDVSFVGWEKSKGKLHPRVVNLSTSMDPVKLADSAVDLNLKLMLWRMLPNMDLEVLHKTRCLILGSGTLGCNVARQLLAWGFRTLTFVDNSTVSYSNPVRQSLFTFEDAKSHAPKAAAAAEAIKRILPSANVSSHNLSIPMPGHPVSNASVGPNASQLLAETREACAQLEKLIREHDVIFLLLDTREARWLPTLLSTYYNKLAITAALGFDSFLVMRHGATRQQGVSPSASKATAKAKSGGDFSKTVEGGRLGCYFCNDVVGPANSTRDRTLDQQCTVARPGASMVASALAVELCVGLLQHADGMYAAAQTRGKNESDELQGHTFGFLPHQIRGFLSQFSEVAPSTTAFEKCSACSQMVLDAFRKDGFEFLLRVFDDASHVEKVCGLTELQLESYFDDVMVLSDEDEAELASP